MKMFEWIPNKSIGDLVFNMTREETRKAMGDAVYTPWFKGRSDIYDEHSIRLDYDRNGLLEAVEFLGFEKEIYEVWYKGKIIYPITRKEFFKIFDRKIFKSDDTTSYQCNELNISVTWSRDHGPAFLVAREHYWEEADILIEEISLITEQHWKLQQGMSREETRKIMKEKTDKLVAEGQTDIYCNHLIVKFDDKDRMIATKFDFNGPL